MAMTSKQSKDKPVKRIASDDYEVPVARFVLKGEELPERKKKTKKRRRIKSPEPDHELVQKLSPKDGIDQSTLKETDIGNESTAESREKHADEIARSLKTPAELKFEEDFAKRELEIIKQRAKQTYRQNIGRFNDQLEKLPQHFDIPKVGPG
ncbi:MAG: hypothetical protein EZS28_004501 [Streblomastix strix]|uniref:DUF1754-domain-containing protein n=1 Tax=Streblomastix strix TaxID=222440 RepID=A0A5J4WZR3_9EUKA|nr:MAG: hypothetical protein EZS28_004501 [Streblomastix strix]